MKSSRRVRKENETRLAADTKELGINMDEATKKSTEQAAEAFLEEIIEPKISQMKRKLQSSEERGTARHLSNPYMNKQDRTVRFKEQNHGDDTGTVAFYRENTLIPFGFISMENLDIDVYFNDHILTEGQCRKNTKGD